MKCTRSSGFVFFGIALALNACATDYYTGEPRGGTGGSSKGGSVGKGGSNGTAGTASTNTGGTSTGGTDNGQGSGEAGSAGDVASGGTSGGGTSTGGTSSSSGGSSTAGSSNGGSSSAGSANGGTGGSSGGTGGSSGGTSVETLDRDFQFDTNVTPWSLSQYGSTPNVGSAGGSEKLSAKSTLAYDATNGNPDKGAAKLTIPFTTIDEQLDFNSFFNDSRENWTGFKARARIRLVSGGNTNPACPNKAWIYITATDSYSFARGAALNLTSGWQSLAFDFAAPAEGSADLTAVNQLGIQIVSHHCESGGVFGTSTAVVLIDDFQVYKP